MNGLLIGFDYLAGIIRATDKPITINTVNRTNTSKIKIMGISFSVSLVGVKRLDCFGPGIMFSDSRFPVCDTFPAN